MLDETEPFCLLRLIFFFRVISLKMVGNFPGVDKACMQDLDYWGLGAQVHHRWIDSSRLEGERHAAIPA